MVKAILTLVVALAIGFAVVLAFGKSREGHAEAQTVVYVTPVEVGKYGHPKAQQVPGIPIGFACHAEIGCYVLSKDDNSQ